MISGLLFDKITRGYSQDKVTHESDHEFYKLYKLKKNSVNGNTSDLKQNFNNFLNSSYIFDKLMYAKNR